MLLGDAAHAMLPHLGQGANQGIEDGVALAIFLEGRSAGEVPDILPQYEKFRRERTDVVQAEARKNGLRYDSIRCRESRDRLSQGKPHTRSRLSRPTWRDMCSRNYPS